MYTVKPDGSIQCETSEEALRLSNMIVRTGSNPSLNRPVAVRRRGGNGSPYRGKGLAVLKAIKEGANGMRADQIAQSVGLSNPRGIGPIFGYLKRTLKRSDINLLHVVERRRHENERLWYPKAKIGDAIKVLEQ